MRAELRALTIRTSHSPRGAQRTERPTFFCDWRFKSVLLRSAQGFALPQKVTSHDSGADGRGKLILYHHQLRAAGQKLTLPRRNWRCPARRHEIQPEAIELALPLMRAYARSSAGDYCVSARTGNANDREELEEVRRRNHGGGLATRFFRSPLARPSRIEGEDQSYFVNVVATGLLGTP